MTSPFAVRTHKEMRPVLLDQEASGPEIYYYMIRGGTEKKNITIFDSGRAGREYIKSFGHYHIDDLPEVYTIISGTGILLTQERMTGEDGKPINDEIASITATFVKAGDSIEISGRAGHLLVNTGESWLISIDDSPVASSTEAEASKPAHADYDAVEKLQGFAYYIVEGTDGPEFVKNSHYRRVPEIIIKK